jgi:NADH-quinone oxidoreductase subunit G
VVEGPRHIEHESVISQNHYEYLDMQKLKKEIDRQIVFQKGKQLPENSTEQATDNARPINN